jgi:ribosomal protein S16
VFVGTETRGTNGRNLETCPPRSSQPVVFPPEGGRFIEELGRVDPLEKETSRQVALKKDRIEHWLARGATTSETVRRLLVQNGIAVRA